MNDLSILENKIIAKYFMNNIDVFTEYIKNHKNFLNLINFYTQPGSNNIRMNMEFFSLMSVLKYYEGLEDNLNRSILKEFLLTYFTYETKNYNLWYKAYDKVHYELLEDDEEYCHYINFKTLEEYQKNLLEKTINPILDKVCIDDTLITNNPSISIDIDQIIKDFYKEVSENSFNIAINEFDRIKESILSKYIKEELHKDFIKYSNNVIKEIYSLYNTLFKNGIFENKQYNSNAKIKWVPILEDSINFHEFSYSTSIKEAIEIYIFIYTMRETIKNNNDSNVIIAKNIDKVSGLSYILNLIQHTVRMSDNDFKYIFIKILKDFSRMSDEELTFIISKFYGLKKSTFIEKEKHNSFPHIDIDISLRKIFNIQTNQDIKPYEINFKNPIEHYYEIQKFRHNNLMSLKLQE